MNTPPAPRNPALLTLWVGELTARLGEGMFQIALLWFLLEVTGSSADTGLVTMITYAPAFLVGLWSGVLVDRLDYRRVMLGANLARIAITAMIPVLFLADRLPVPALALAGFLASSAAAFFGPARDAIIPLLADKSRLLSANSLVQSAWQFSLVVGPFLAAALLPYMPTVFLFWGVSAAFALSLLALLFLPRQPREGLGEPVARDAARAGASSGGLLADFLEGWRYLLAERRVFWIWGITLVNNFFLMGPVFVGMPVFVKQHLGGSSTDFALIEGGYAVGMIVSTWLVARLGVRLNPLRLLFLALIYDGLTFVPLLWIDSMEGTMVAIVIHSLGIPGIVVSRITVLHGLVPQAMQGRVFSFFHLAVAGMTALSIGVTGWVLTVAPANQVFAVIGVLAGLTGVAGFLIPALWEG
ncbi:MAG: MFS transporter [Deltaproteobacteria bacterium]|nr:MFS transporter [Deltaproteobacteria bacterium]